ncbi:hypothetical protein ACFWN1_17680 [Streptomyces sp. NPDC058459]|uniref:hypothetical protein n=1 Tax=Streptomyces sp. NPDC058459 TaxID=3346508 RepID=UPI003669F883
MATTRHDTVVTRWAVDHHVHDLFPGLPRHWRRRRQFQARISHYNDAATHHQELPTRHA